VADLDVMVPGPDGAAAGEPPGPAEIRRWFPAAGHGTQAGVRLVCLPGLGAGIAPYNRWRRMLPSWVEVTPVRLPGTEARLNEPPVARLEPLVSHLDSLLVQLPAKPTVLLGHCFGAIIAYELARAMTDHGHPPALLWVHGQVSPAGIARIPDTGSHPWERFGRYADLPAAVRADSAMRRMLTPVLTAQFAILDSYTAPVSGRRLAVPVIASRGEDDPMITAADVAGWESVTGAAATLLTVPGGHVLDREPVTFLAEVARWLEPLRIGPPA
jgi:surfactin synthase thioesterase subunit